MGSTTNGTRRPGAAVAVGGFLAAALLAGCGDEADPAEAAAEYCSAVEDLRAEVTAFADAVASDATVGDLQEQRGLVAEAAEQVDEAAEGRDEAVAGAVEQAQERFAEAVGDIDDDTVLSEAVTAYEEAATAYQSDLGDIAVDAGC